MKDMHGNALRKRGRVGEMGDTCQQKKRLKSRFFCSCPSIQLRGELQKLLLEQLTPLYPFVL
jgi:hypothetical protein